MSKPALSDFEDFIPAPIVQRGYNYFVTGAVEYIEQVKTGQWEAVVEGTEPYVVFIELDDQTIESWDCTCPYGAPCKHVAAVLYQLKEFYKITDRKAPSKQERLAKARAILQEKEQPQKETPPATALPVLKPKATPVEKFNAWQKLEPIDQTLVKIVALSWQKIEISKITAVFKNNRTAVLLQQYTNADVIKGRLKQLVEAGFLAQRNVDFYCDLAFAHLLCESVYLTDPDFIPLIEQIKIETYRHHWYMTVDDDLRFRNMRFGLYFQNLEAFSEGFEQLRTQSTEWQGKNILSYWLPDNDVRTERIERFPENIRHYLLSQKLDVALEELSEPSPYFDYIESHVTSFPDKIKNEVLEKLAVFYLWRGESDALKRTITNMTFPAYLESYKAILLLLQGYVHPANEQFAIAEKEWRRYKRSPKAFLQGVPAMFQIIGKLASRDTGHYTRAGEILKKYPYYERGFNAVFVGLTALLRFLENEKKQAVDLLYTSGRWAAIPTAFSWLFKYIVDDQYVYVTEVEKRASQFEKTGYLWLARELRAVIALKSGNPVPSGDTVPLVTLFPKMEEWENALNALIQMGASAQAAKSRENDTRLVWLVDFEKRNLEVKEQTFGKKGWSAGRSVSDERLYRKEVANLSPQDHLVIDELDYTSLWHSISDVDVWQHLAGHPLLFLKKSPEVAVQLVEEKPVLSARQVANGYEMRFIPPVEKSGFEIIKETPTRYKLFVITQEQARIAKAFNGKSLVVPEHGLDRFNQAVSGLAQIITVQSALEMDNTEIPEVPADSRICVHLLPVGNGFHIELYVKPFGSTPPYFKPGEGEKSVLALQDGQRVKAARDLPKEKTALKTLVKQIAYLSSHKPTDQIWEVEDADTCLEVLAQLHPVLATKDITLEWPKGEKFKVTNVVGIDQFRLRISQGSQWFEVSGELQVDEEKVLNMQELLALSEQQKSGFIEVGPGKFLAITAEFRKKLREINGLMPLGKNNKLQLHPLAATAFQTLTDVVKNADIDPAFVKNQEKIREAFAQKFKLPKKFNATLRPYQQEGFEWLHRMAAWGVGACLADDMGLGKTIQALAFLTDKAAKGPALVVAPVSVCRNWMNETKKFAPSLHPILFGEGDREKVIADAQKGDVVVATYDLLTREATAFQSKKWSVIILDEAQAIKNRMTKRSEVAMKLEAEFKLLMSGTPVENHLGELWNLFQFANPGLLGSIDQFSQRFAIPIEKNNDESRRDQLRRLVQPFILRRRKDEVLKELPAKTEITLQVELTPEERAFYEALRRKVLETLESDKEDAGAGEKHLRILAEIMKLRRAACHPKLADENSVILESAKQRLFGEIVTELIENGHKALVFSQFVSHLAILEKYLKKQKIAYQYLDGQTPAAKRQERIDAFQRGEGDLFLISLKAGGAGLNLTAADYVIHMDPWWNPAVEDQATDRAHRIGQEKPVTVYRLVTEGTIEEKIIQLHERKRDLADSLLSGTGVSAKLSADELMALLKSE